MVRMYSQTFSRKPPPSLLGTTTPMPKTKDARDHEIRNRLFELLLGAELVGVSALALSAVGGTGRETGLEVGRQHRNRDVVAGEGNVRSTCGRSSCRS